MGKSKKILAVVFVLMTAVLSLYSQTQNISSVSDENSVVLSEDSIIISDNSTNQSSSENLKHNSTIGVFIRMIVVLIIVIALIYGVLWFIKKKTNVVKSEDDYLRRAAYINIAPGKTVEVITLIDKAYLIGVTEDNITLLGEIHDEELIKAMNLNADKKANTKKPLNFSEVLDTFLLKNGKQKNIFGDAEKKVDNLFSNTSSENLTDGE